MNRLFLARRHLLILIIQLHYPLVSMLFAKYLLFSLFPPYYSLEKLPYRQVFMAKA